MKSILKQRLKLHNKDRIFLVKKKPRDRVHDNPYILTLDNSIFNYDRWNMLSTYKKFLFVRNPLERVISTYRDKLEFLTGEEKFDFRPYFKKIVQDKFGDILGIDSTTGAVSFPDLVRFIISQDVDERIVLDPHWLSIHELCNPCAIRYDFIGKFEHLKEDVKAALTWLEVDQEVSSLPPPVRSVNTSRVASQYLEQLPRSMRLSLLNKYLMDYLTFDYEFGT
ncbi:hypothetical protein SK128_019850 [Halocaridina rubra]|uniref:Carbohydrate sulfotransferase n=1 Tax=Halocaridina rubra TaxID=373956 RepID=A0AAN8X5N9_HALRR